MSESENHGDQTTDSEQKSSPNIVGSIGPVTAHVTARFKQSEDTRQPAADADWCDSFHDER